MTVRRVAVALNKQLKDATKIHNRNNLPLDISLLKLSLDFGNRQHTHTHTVFCFVFLFYLQRPD